MKELLLKIFSSDSTISSSRIFAFISLICFLSFAVTTMLTSYTVNDKYIDGLLWIIGICIGGSTVSKFSGEGKDNGKNIQGQ